MSPPLALLVVGAPRVHALKRGLGEAHWRVEASATVFDAIKQLPLKPTAIVCDGSVGDLKLRKLLGDPGCAGVTVYALDGAPAGVTSLQGLDDQAAIAKLVERHGGRVVAPRPTVRTERHEPLETWWENGQLFAEVEDERQGAAMLDLARLAEPIAHPVLPRTTRIEPGDRAKVSWELSKGVSLTSIGRLLHHHNTLLSLEAVCTLGHAVSEGLEAIHAAGHFHGMVRPWSVWVTDEGAPKLLFSLLGRLHEADRTVERRAAIGTIRRKDDLSPEQLSHTPVSAKTDLYQLGHLLFVELTGHSPFGQGGEERALHGERPSLDADDLPATVAALPPKLLAIDPAQRPSAAEVAATLAPYKGDPAAVTQELSQWVRRFHEELG